MCPIFSLSRCLGMSDEVTRRAGISKRKRPGLGYSKNLRATSVFSNLGPLSNLSKNRFKTKRVQTSRRESRIAGLTVTGCGLNSKVGSDFQIEKSLLQYSLHLRKGLLRRWLLWPPNLRERRRCLVLSHVTCSLLWWLLENCLCNRTADRAF